jgi:hypothetical protein
MVPACMLLKVYADVKLSMCVGRGIDILVDVLHTQFAGAGA